MQEENDDIKLAQWLSGELSNKEVEELRANDDLQALEDIVAETERWALPAVSSNFEDLKRKREEQNKKPASRSYFIRIAASIVLLLGASFFSYIMFFNTTEYSTMVGETKSFQLPDGTDVTLNGNSSISFSNFGWEDDRKVEMEGQAYFDVHKKGPFEVSFSEGSVQVLGTQFDVLSYNNSRNVMCYEGKVQVQFDAESFILEKNMGVRTTKGSSATEFQFATEQVGWDAEYTKLNKAPLNEVLVALALHYGLTFDGLENVENTKIFTGQFPNSDVETALLMVTESLNIKYRKEKNHVHLQ